MDSYNETLQKMTKTMREEQDMTVETIDKQITFWRCVTRDWEVLLRACPDDMQTIEMLRLSVNTLHALMHYKQALAAMESTNAGTQGSAA